jgi:hypothetical protein
LGTLVGGGHGDDVVRPLQKNPGGTVADYFQESGGKARVLSGGISREGGEGGNDVLFLSNCPTFLSRNDGVGERKESSAHPATSAHPA